MSYILILYFMGTHVAYDIPTKDACADQAHKLATVLQRKATGKPFGNFSYSHQCLPQTPATIEIAKAIADKEYK